VLDVRRRKAAGLQVKINTVALRESATSSTTSSPGARSGFDLVLIENCTVGDRRNRLERYLPLSLVRARLERRWTLDGTVTAPATAPYAVVRNRTAVGYHPLTHNFCESCNRVRLTCTGTLYMCLGQEDAADGARRCGSRKATNIRRAIHEAIARKPRTTISSSTAATSGRPLPAT
jgi:cyclic pyranopterin phosphate synthase